MAVSLRDESEFWNSAGSCYRASSRDAMPLALRLPRPQSGLAMTQNWSVFIWKTDAFCCMRSFFAWCCFVPGCHAFGFKIATAAGRPRNDKIGVFLFGKRTHFVVCGHFCVVLLRTDFQIFRFENCPVFPQDLPNLSLRGGRVRPTRQSLTERDGIPERSAADRISYAARISIGYHRDAPVAAIQI